MNRREAWGIIQRLHQEGKLIEKLGTELLRRAHLRYEDRGNAIVLGLGLSHYGWLPLDQETRDIQRDALAEYEKWCSLGLKLVEAYMPARLKDFENRYRDIDLSHSRHTVPGWLQLSVSPYSGQNEDAVRAFIDAFDVQRGIVEGIAAMVENQGPTIYEYTSPVYWFQRLKGRVAPWLSEAWNWLYDHPIAWILGLIFTLLATDWLVLGQNVRELVRWITSLIR